MRKVTINSAIKKIELQLKFKDMESFASWDQEYLDGCYNCKHGNPVEICHYDYGFVCAKYKKFPEYYTLVITKQTIKSTGTVVYSVNNCAGINPDRVYKFFTVNTSLRDDEGSIIKNFKVCRRFIMR